MPPYERPALSKEFLAGTRDEASLLLRPATFWDEHGIELVLGDRVEAARRRRASATSSRPRARVRRARRSRPAPARGGCRSSCPAACTCCGRWPTRARCASELAPGARLVVVGGGLVGAEVASTALALGVHVTIVEAAAAPLARVLGPTVGLLLAERWRAHGVDVRLGAAVARFRPDAAGRVEAVQLADGTELRADAVLVGVGAEPARELLPRRPGPARPSRRRRRRPGPLDRGGPRRRRGRAPDPRPAGARRSRHYAWSDQFGLRLQVVGTPQPRRHASSSTAPSDSFAARYLGADGAPTPGSREPTRRGGRTPPGAGGATVGGVKPTVCDPCFSAPSSWSPQRPPRSRSTCSCSAARRTRASRSDG